MLTTISVQLLRSRRKVRCAQGQAHSLHNFPSPSHDRINRHGSDRTTRRTSEEPYPQSLFTPLDQNGRGASEEKTISELEMDLLPFSFAGIVAAHSVGIRRLSPLETLAEILIAYLTTFGEVREPVVGAKTE